MIEDSNDTLMVASHLSLAYSKGVDSKGEANSTTAVGWLSWLADSLWGKNSKSTQDASILILPIELLERIFILSSSNTLPLASRTFILISSSPLVKAKWIIQKYGVDEALGRCWRLRFMNCTVPDIEVAARLKLSVEQQKAMQAYFVRRRKCGCYARRLTVNEIMQMDVETNAESTGAAAHQLRRSFLQRWWHLCEILASELTRRRRLLFSLQVVDETVLKKSPWLKSPCEIERSQCYLITTLLSLGAVVNGGGNMALRFAARRGHLYLIELLLMNGADPDAWVPVPSNPLIRWARKSHRIGGGVILSAGQEAAPASPSLNIPQNAIDGIITVDAFMQANLPNDIAGGFGQPQQHHSLLSGHRPLRDILKRKPDLKVSLLLQAVKANHICLARLLIKPRTIMAHTRNLTPLSQQGPLLYHVHYQHTHGEGVTPAARVSRINMHAALREAFSESKYEMCRVLIEDGGATTTPHMVHELIARASTWRLTIGIREKLTHFLVLAIQHLPEEDFVRMSAILVRSSAEIGSEAVMRICIERGADVNVWEGLPLYASVYNGNLEVAKYLLADGGADTSLFNWKQKGFCLGLILIEGFAILMFSMLVGMWAVGMGQMIRSAVTRGRSGGNTFTMGTYAEGVSVGELTGMAVPSAIALAVMYRLVPFHRMCMGFLLVCREDARRRRARRVNGSSNGAENDGNAAATGILGGGSLPHP